MRISKSKHLKPQSQFTAHSLGEEALWGVWLSRLLLRKVEGLGKQQQQESNSVGLDFTKYGQERVSHVMFEIR